MAEYRVVLDGGSRAAVVPVNDPAPREETWVFLYHKPTGRWMGRKKYGTVTAHAPYWKVPQEPIIIGTPLPPPE